MEEYEVTQLKILGLETRKIPFPKWLKRYEDRPLNFYRLFMQYQGQAVTYRNKKFSGHCALILKTSVENYGGVAFVKGHIFIKNYSTLDLPLSSYVPKEKIICPQLSDYVASYIGSYGLGDKFFDYNIFGNIENELFSCKLDYIPMVNITADTVDMVSVNMKLFKPV